MWQVQALLINAQQSGSGAAIDIDQARMIMQKAAYEISGGGYSPDEQASFKQRMTEFASADPLVRLISIRVQQLCIDNPGQLQSKIYRHFPEFTKDEVRYGIYFAAELGWIIRKKKGNSYQLFPPGVSQ